MIAGRREEHLRLVLDRRKAFEWTMRSRSCWYAGRTSSSASSTLASAGCRALGRLRRESLPFPCLELFSESHNKCRPEQNLGGLQERHVTP